MNYKLTFTHILLLALLGIPSSTVNAQQWRVIAEVNELYSNTAPNGFYVIDSTAYQYDYSANRGSDMYNDTILFDKAIYFRLDASQLKPARQYIRTYTNDNKQLTELKQNYDPTVFWKPQYADTFTYSNGNMINKKRYEDELSSGQTYWTLSSEDKFVYNTKNLPIVVDNYQYDGQIGKPLKNVYRRYSSYNSNDKNIGDSAIYNNNNVWETLVVTSNTYNANGDIILRENFSPDINGNNVLTYKTYYYYNTSGQLIGDSISTVIPNHPKTPRINAYTYNSAGQVIADTLKTPGTQPELYVYAYSYTSFGYISMIEEGEYVPGVGLDISQRTRYRYEHYWPTSVAEKNLADDLTIYPVPAKDLLTINWGIGVSTTIQAQIVNTQGQVVDAWMDKAESNYTKQINTTNLPVGNYYLRMNADGREVTKSFVVVR